MILVDLLHEEEEPTEWRSVHVGAERGVNCEHVGPGDKYIPETLEVAGRPTDRVAARILQIKSGLHGKLGREDGSRRGHALSGMKDSHLDRSPRTCGGTSVG